MNDEIKEILDYFQKDVDKYEESKRYLMQKYGYDEETIDNISQHKRHINTKKLFNYITDLQQENERLKAQLIDTEWEYQNTRCKYEKQYIKGTTEEILEDIEQCFFNRENPTMIPIDSLDVCHIFGYIDYLKDYKSRCEKASDKIKKIRENAIKYGANHDAVICDDLLNILQNGSEKDE